MKKIVIVQNCLMHYRIPVFNLIAKKYELTVIHSGDYISEDEIIFKQEIVVKRKLGSFYYQKELSNKIHEVAPEVVIGMFDIRWVSIILIMLRMRFKNKKFILWGHRYSKNKIANFIRDILMRISSSVLLYGNEEVDEILKKGLSKTKIFIAPNTIDVVNSYNYCNEFKSSFIFVGRAQKRKQVDVFIRAFAQVLPNIDERITIDIVGDGDENDKLKELCSKLKISHRVIFHGTVTDESTLAKLFSKSYAYISPGPVGLGVLHSLAYGVPVVTRSNQKHGPEFHNLENEINSLIYETNDELLTIIHKLANQSSLTKDLGSNAFDFYSKKRSINNMVNGFVRAIENSEI